MNQTARILVVDDDPEIGQLVKDYLLKHQFQVDVAEDGVAMKRLLRSRLFDVIVLDLMLPGESGISLCQKIRETSDVIIIMLSAAGEEADRILGLEIGADDYLAKPFSPRELLARIRALLRRANGGMPRPSTGTVRNIPLLQFEKWQYDRQKHQVSDSTGMVIPLTHAEFELLQIFIDNPRRILTRDQLLDLMGADADNPFDRSIDVRVGRLRKKLEIDAKNPKLILTVRGGGYQFSADVKEVEILVA